MQDVHAVVPGREVVGELSGAVRAGVVNDESVRVGHRRVKPAEDPGQVLPLVVGRDHHEQPGLRCHAGSVMPTPIMPDGSRLAGQDRRRLGLGRPGVWSLRPAPAPGEDQRQQPGEGHQPLGPRTQLVGECPRVA